MSTGATAISAVSSILGGIAGGKGAKKAAKIQAQAYREGLAQQQAQFDQTQANFAPYLAAGNQGLSGYLTLLGLNGNEAQGSAIDALKNSSAFTSQYDTGVDTILQNAAATGGLRGGNTQNSLANFGSNLLNTVIQQQLGNYGGLISTGSGSTSTLGSLGQQNSNAQSQLYGQIGSANATAAAAPYAAFQGIMNSIGGNSKGIASALGW